MYLSFGRAVTTQTQPDDINPELMVGLLWAAGPATCGSVPWPRRMARAFLTSRVHFGVRAWTPEAGFRHESLAMVRRGRAIELF